MFRFGKNKNKHIESLIKLLPSGGCVLDLGCGMGANGIFLNEKGFKVTCIDKDEKAIDIIKEKHPEIETSVSNILDFEFPNNTYDAILIINVLHFFNVNQIYNIIKKIKQSLKKGGIVYLEVFSVNDSLHSNFKAKARKVSNENNTFFSQKTNSFSHFFEQDELKNLFVDSEIILIEENAKEDNHPPIGIHKHAIIKMIAKK